MSQPTINASAGSGLAGRVGTAIQRASARTGVDFDYLFNQARIESGLNPNARARTSSATGLFQFIDQTWLATVRQHGAEHGLGWAAAAIQRGADGRYHVADPVMRRAILDLRRQPEAASAMAAEFAADNRAFLEQRLGRPVEPVDLYLAHFLGAGGASRFLAAHESNPGAAAAAVMPAAARANRWVFYDSNGAPRTLEEVRTRFAEKMGGGAPGPSGPSGTMPPIAPPSEATTLRLAAMQDRAVSAPATAGPPPQYARLAYLMLAELGG
ncbi:transglycosylase SLT domain-containing protein [Sphingosinicella sp. CPCC 101087]|uniref:transglycosylase SLT domain-containing protein n=1 Tax=Sphingosinicella sp. CPCC 101087 TaxID=2497754 RepID=UPI00101B8912|nr:transglycosylase SLT domain-containing protein [Sphingosinicella sp. CPCC 101087]